MRPIETYHASHRDFARLRCLRAPSNCIGARLTSNGLGCVQASSLARLDARDPDGFPPVHCLEGPRAAASFHVSVQEGGSCNVGGDLGSATDEILGAVLSSRGRGVSTAEPGGHCQWGSGKMTETASELVTGLSFDLGRGRRTGGQVT